MDYIKVEFKITDAEEYQVDLLTGALGDIGFDSFSETEDGLDAFIIEEQYSVKDLEECLKHFESDFVFTWKAEKVAPENWNTAWEKNFSPLIVNEECYVRATFHESQPQYKYEIVIDPKMAFGTGHHETTTMMLQYILGLDVADKAVLDMGCGTGILAILAAFKGAKPVTAIDYDILCYDSTKENAALNNVQGMQVILGGKEVIPQQQFELILANINRNILLDQIPAYADVLVPGGTICYSGFYESPDLDMIKAKCAEYGMEYQDHKKKGEWVAAKFIKHP